MQTEQHSGRASKGSQLHLQKLVNDYPEYLNCLILSSSPSLCTYAATHPEWVSPLASNNYTEYQDKHFLEAIGSPQLSDKLSDFWPSRGPVWDALATIEGKNGSQGVILVEAKSHIPELSGPGCRASPTSRAKIDRSLDTVKQVLGVKPEADWTGEFYQYANRLAHLYFLNVVAQVPTWMVFLYFAGDTKQNGPSTVAEWIIALDETKVKLGLPKHHLLDQRIVSVFAPVAVRTFTAVLHKEEDLYVAKCPEVGTVSQGYTVEEANIDEMEWLRAAAANPAFDFLKEPEEDIYKLADGRPYG